MNSFQLYDCIAPVHGIDSASTADGGTISGDGFARGRKVHEHPVPRIGGLAFAIGACASIAWWGQRMTPRSPCCWDV